MNSIELPTFDNLEIYWGKIDLTNGNIKSYKIYNNYHTFEYKQRKLCFTYHLKLDLLVNYDYYFKGMINLQGTVSVTVKYLIVKIDTEIDLKKMVSTIIRLVVSNTSLINVEFKNGTFDFFFNLFTGRITNYIRETVISNARDDILKYLRKDYVVPLNAILATIKRYEHHSKFLEKVLNEADTLF